MSREAYLIDRIDRRREANVTREARTARSMFLRMKARRDVSACLADLPEHDRATYITDCLDILAEHLHPMVGRVPAATAYNRVAADICATIKLKQAVAGAEADRVFAKLTAANDGGLE